MTPPPTNIRFCEPTGATVAEWHNTWSSGAYVLAALDAYARNDRRDADAAALSAALALTGVGSALLHGTQQLWGEWVDEGGMLVFIVLCLRSLLVRRGPRLRDALPGANAAVFGLYMWTNWYALFLQAFTLQAVLVAVLFCVDGRPNDAAPAPWRMIVIAGLAKLAWEIEQRAIHADAPDLCSRYPQLHWLHVAWHLGSAWVARDAILYLAARHRPGLGPVLDETRCKRP